MLRKSPCVLQNSNTRPFVKEARGNRVQYKGDKNVNYKPYFKTVYYQRRECGIFLIIKKHPLQSGWSLDEGTYTNIRYVTEEMLQKSGIQLYELVGLMDGLISDYSSIAVDYMLLDRPLAMCSQTWKAIEIPEDLCSNIRRHICQVRRFTI